MRKTLILTALVVVMLGAGTPPAPTLLAKVPPLPDPDKPRAKAFVLPDQNGETVIMSKFQGMIVVLEWTNLDCPFSKRHYQEGTFKDLYKKYRYGLPSTNSAQANTQQPGPALQRARRMLEIVTGRKRRGKKVKVVWLAINSSRDATVEANKTAAQEFAVPYPILDDHEGKVGRLYGAKNTPHIFIKAPDGTIAYQGAIDNDPEAEKEPEERINYADQALEALLSGKEVGTPETEPYGCSVKYAKQR